MRLFQHSRFYLKCKYNWNQKKGGVYNPAFLMIRININYSLDFSSLVKISLASFNFFSFPKTQ